MCWLWSPTDRSGAHTLSNVTFDTNVQGTASFSIMEWFSSGMWQQLIHNIAVMFDIDHWMWSVNMTTNHLKMGIEPSHEIFCKCITDSRKCEPWLLFKSTWTYLDSLLLFFLLNKQIFRIHKIPVICDRVIGIRNLWLLQFQVVAWFLNLADLEVRYFIVA
jgi:hypothetical protein